MKEKIDKSIEKHLHFQGGTDDKWFLRASIKHYLETGRVSGSFYDAIRSIYNELISHSQDNLTTSKGTNQ